jgi:hypothetical protein
MERSADRSSRTVWFDESGFDTRSWLIHWGYALKGERFESVEAAGQGSRIDCLTSFDSDQTHTT